MRYQCMGRTAWGRVVESGGVPPRTARRARAIGTGEEAMNAGAYRFALRPAAVDHGHPVLVFDGGHRLHLPLTVFVKDARFHVSLSTSLSYLHALLPFFAFVDREAGHGDGRQWGAPPADVRRLVEAYLACQHRCLVRPHRAGFQLVSLTAGTHSTIRVFLSALKLFYRVMHAQGAYAFTNPLQDSVRTLMTRAEESIDDDDGWPRMPEISGVVAPRRPRRLSDSYFKLVGADWVPQVVDDPSLPARVLAGGRRLPRWGLREECVTRLLFESGGRVSEVTGLTLGDWLRRGLLQEATAFSKGSHGRRVKFLRFSSDTAKLLRRYVDGERRRLDPRGLTCTGLLEPAARQLPEVLAAPVFLSARRTPLTPKHYRENAWNPACAAAAIDADVHQARHWYVTMAVRQIYETATTEAAVTRRLRELIEYMKWRRGEQTLAAYEHYFDTVRHAEIQDRVHARLDDALRAALAAPRRPRPADPSGALAPGPGPVLDDPEWVYLRRFSEGAGGGA
ncbi:MAG: integrase [Gemmatimonadetes bacterium]|nr:integrase [Gemmatimonadota bacterium]